MSGKLTPERAHFLVDSVTSSLGRAQTEGRGNIVVFHFLYLFQLEFAKTNVGKNTRVQPQGIALHEFNFVVEVFRRLARRMPEAFHLENAPIQPTESPARIVGWHNMDKISQYWTPGLDKSRGPIEEVIQEVMLDPQVIRGVGP